MFIFTGYWRCDWYWDDNDGCCGTDTHLTHCHMQSCLLPPPLTSSLVNFPLPSRPSPCPGIARSLAEILNKTWRKFTEKKNCPVLSWWERNLCHIKSEYDLYMCWSSNNAGQEKMHHCILIDRIFINKSWHQTLSAGFSIDIPSAISLKHPPPGQVMREQL